MFAAPTACTDTSSETSWATVSMVPLMKPASRL